MNGEVVIHSSDNEAGDTNHWTMWKRVEEAQEGNGHCEGNDLRGGARYRDRRFLNIRELGQNSPENKTVRMIFQNHSCKHILRPVVMSGKLHVCSYYYASQHSEVHP